MKSINQLRHERLIEFLSRFKQYQYDGKPRLKKMATTVPSHVVHKLPASQINQAAVVVADVLNLGGGSVGTIDLYALFHAYFSLPETRVRINQLVRAEMSADYERRKELSKN